MLLHGIIKSIYKQLIFTSHAQQEIHEALLFEYERRDEVKIDGFDVRKLRMAEDIKLILDVTRPSRDNSNVLALLLDAPMELFVRHDLQKT